MPISPGLNGSAKRIHLKIVKIDKTMMELCNIVGVRCHILSL